MTDFRSNLITAAFAWIPYVSVAWGGTKVTELDFIQCLGALLGIRLFFSIIEGLGSTLSWRIYGRRQAIERNLNLLRTYNFPRRAHAQDDFLSYLAHIQSEDAYPANVKTAARQWEQVLEFTENLGIIAGMRMHSATDDALDIYSPKHSAPNSGVSDA